MARLLLRGLVLLVVVARSLFAAEEAENGAKQLGRLGNRHGAHLDCVWDISHPKGLGVRRSLIPLAIERLWSVARADRSGKEDYNLFLAYCPGLAREDAIFFGLSVKYPKTGDHRFYLYNFDVPEEQFIETVIRQLRMNSEVPDVESKADNKDSGTARDGDSPEQINRGGEIGNKPPIEPKEGMQAGAMQFSRLTQEYGAELDLVWGLARQEDEMRWSTIPKEIDALRRHLLTLRKGGETFRLNLVYKRCRSGRSILLGLVAEDGAETRRYFVQYLFDCDETIFFNRAVGELASRFSMRRAECDPP